MTLSAIAVLVSASVGASATAPPNNNVLVVSGGISLGAYQAGATYALMHHLAQRRRESNAQIDFPVATGASAGNVNAFLAALTWCDEDGNASNPGAGLPLAGPTQNLFYRTWVEIGLDRLSPDQHNLGIDDYRALFEKANRDQIGSVYTKNDALLTRNAFVDAVRMLEDTIGRRRFRSNCAVDLGITLTRSAPVFLNSGSKSREQVLSERFVVPFHAREKEKRIVFTNFPRKWSNDQQTIGPRVAMPEDSRHEIDFAADLAELIKASAAFPVAFAAIPLDVCEPDDVVTPKGPNSPDGTPDRTFGCPQEHLGVGKFNPRRIFFSDGGFFDNVPLGLAGVMVPPDEAGQRQPAQYWYVNSDIRRPPRKTGEQPAIGGGGLGFLATWFGRGIAEARSYELQTLARYRPEWFGFGRSPDKPCPPGSSCFHVIDRFAPLVGDYLSSFGAFANRSFRIYDYYAGIYDGLINVAASPDPDREQQQFLLWYAKVLRPGGESSDPVGESIVQMLAAWEHPGWKGTLAEKFPLAAGAPACDKKIADPRLSLPVLVLDTLKLISDERERLHASGNVQAVMEFNEHHESPLGFWGFLGLLGQRVRQVGDGVYERRCDASEKEKTALRDLPGRDDAGDLDGWTAQQGNALARRLIEVEKADRRRPQPGRPDPGEDGEEPLANPCHYDHVALCLRDVIPNFVDLVTTPSIENTKRTNLGWQTSLFPLASPSAPSGKQLLLRARFVHTLALQQQAHPSDRLTVGLGYAHGVDPAAFSIDLAAVAYRFPAPPDRHPFSVLRGGLELSLEWKVLRASVQYRLGNSPVPGTDVDRSLVSLGLRNLNVPFGWLFRQTDRLSSADPDTDWSWPAQYAGAGATLLVPMLVERPVRRLDWFGFRGESSKARVLAGAAGWEYAVAAVVPNHVDLDLLSDSAIFGYEPLRWNALGEWIPKGVFLDLGLGVRRFLAHRGDSPDSKASWHVGGSLGLGYDPAGRFVDDIRFAPTLVYAWDKSIDGGGGWKTGAEVSALFLGGFLRVGFALPKLFSAAYAKRDGAIDAMAVSVGLGDVDGLTASVLRWWLLPTAFDEGRKDGETR